MNTVLYHLCLYYSDTFGFVPCSRSYLCYACNLSYWKVSRELKRLLKDGYVSYSKCFLGSSLFVCGYTLTEKAFETLEYKSSLNFK